MIRLRYRKRDAPQRSRLVRRRSFDVLLENKDAVIYGVHGSTYGAGSRVFGGECPSTLRALPAGKTSVIPSPTKTRRWHPATQSK